MELKQAQEARLQLQTVIQNLLGNYQTVHGLHVSDISLTKIPCVGVPPVLIVKLTCELPEI